MNSLTFVRRIVRLGLTTALAAIVPHAALAQTWSVAGNMAAARHFASTTVLNDGRVLIVGGTADQALNAGLQTVDILDPSTGVTVAGPLLPEPRFWHAAVKLADGRVAIIGGAASVGGVVANTMYVFNPASNTWSVAAPMLTGRARPLSALLSDGRVMVVGGAFTDEARTVEIYDPSTNSWTASAAMQFTHLFGAAITLNDGRILVAGGQPNSDAEVFDPATGLWSPAGTMNDTLALYGTLVRCQDGRVAMTGSLSGLVDTYNPSTGAWTLASPMPTPVVLPGVARLADGRVMAAGGSLPDGSADVSITQIYDPAADTWSAGPTMNGPHSTGTLAALANGAWVIAGVYASGNTAIEILGAAANAPPVADAGPDVTGVTCDACASVVTVNATGSSDPEGTPLTYVWSIDGATVLTTSNPIATLAVPVGTTTITLTVRDARGLESSDTVTAVVTNVEDGYRTSIASLHSQIDGLNAQVTSLQNQVDTLQTQIAPLQASLQTCEASQADTRAALAGLQQLWRVTFNAPGFTLPGDTAGAQIQNLIAAIGGLKHGHQRALFTLLASR